MGRTRVVRILLACTAAVVLAGGCAFVEKIEQLTIDDIDVAAVRDGEYTGTVRILPVTAKVRVAVKDGAITGIDLVRHFHGPDHGAEQILGRVIEAQSLRGRCRVRIHVLEQGRPEGDRVGAAEGAVTPGRERRAGLTRWPGTAATPR